MAEQTFEQTDSNQPKKSGKGGGKSTQSIGDYAAVPGREFKETADFADTSGEKLKEGTSQFVDAARDTTSHATDRISETVSQQKDPGTEYVGSIAEAMRRASRQFDQELPIVGKYIRKAASQVEDVADSFRSGDFSPLVSGASSFVRRQPLAFLGLATLAGFAAVRFLKSSREDSQASYRPSSGQSIPRREPASEAPTEYPRDPRPSGADYVG